MTNKFIYSDKIETNIFYEEETENPFVGGQRYLHGYNLIDLSKKKSFTDVFLMMFTGELPNKQSSKVFEILSIGLINLGPRNHATRSAMIAGVSKTSNENILPLGQVIAGGNHGGGIEIMETMEFIKINIDKSYSEINGKNILGFGTVFGSIDPYIESLSNEISLISPDCKYIKWINEINKKYKEEGKGILMSGLVAAVFLSLGIGSREAVSVFQIICSPGIAAQGMEQTHKPITSMPFLEDKNYKYKDK